MCHSLVRFVRFILVACPLVLTAPAEAQEIDADGQAALALLDRVIAAYRTAPVIEDLIQIRSSMGGVAEPNEERYVLLGPGGQSIVTTSINEMISTDTAFFVTSKRVPDKYLQVPMKGDPPTMLRSLGSKQRFIHYALRYGQDRAEVLRALSFSTPGRLRPSRVRTIKDGTGREFQQATFSSPEGVLTLNVHPESGLLHEVVSDQTPTDAPVGNFHILAHARFNTKVHASLPRPIRFDPAGRLAVASFDAMLDRTTKAGEGAPGIKLGDVAPAFSLYTLEGTQFDLASHAGSVVVLDFWASWCLPNRRTLAEVQKVADWANSTNAPVVVVGLNGRERHKEPGKRWEGAHDFWVEQGLEIRSLFDFNGSVTREYGVERLPVTLVIGPDGRVAAVHTGAENGLATVLRKEIESLIRK